MGPKPKRYQHQRCLHFITFSCYHRMRLLESITARNLFERELERVRRWYGFYITGYVVMPEHVHLLISEPERAMLSIVIQMLKQITSNQLKPQTLRRFWQVRYYDFPVWTEKKRIEKLRYIHRNRRGPRQACFWLVGVEVGEARTSGKTRRMALEQLCPLRHWSGGRGGD